MKELGGRFGAQFRPWPFISSDRGDPENRLGSSTDDGVNFLVTTPINGEITLRIDAIHFIHSSETNSPLLRGARTNMGWDMLDDSQRCANVVAISPFLPVEGDNSLLMNTPLSRSAEIRQ